MLNSVIPLRCVCYLKWQPHLRGIVIHISIGIIRFNYVIGYDCNNDTMRRSDRFPQMFRQLILGRRNVCVRLNSVQR